MSLEAFAKEIAERAHSGQTDKAGQPYIEHVIFVANGVSSSKARIVAYLHDIVEDTRWTLDELRLYFDAEVVDAVEHLTRREGESYKDFILRVGANPLAKEVKLVDLQHNMQISRIPNPTNKDLRRLEKYKKAYEALEEIQDETHS